MTTELVAKPLRFYSEADESAFFSWLRSIACVREIAGMGQELRLEIDSSGLSESALRELVAAFYRYRCDMTVFQEFARDPKHSWLNNKRGFWYRRTFRE